MPPLNIPAKHLCRQGYHQSAFGLTTVLFIVFVVLLAGCDSTTPDDLIEEEEYIQILTEMHLIAALKDIHDDEKMYQEGQEKIMDRYGITPEQFYQSHEYYLEDVEAQQERLSKARQQLTDLDYDLIDYEVEFEESTVDTLNQRME